MLYLVEGQCKTWTVDRGLDCGLDRGLDCGLDCGYVLDERCASENWSIDITHDVVCNIYDWSDDTMASIDGEVSANPLQS